MESESLSGLGVARLTDRLKDRLGAVGGLAVESERELARELVRRARREERLRQALSRLLAMVEALGLHQWAGSRPGHPVPKEVEYGLSLTEGQAQELRAAAQEARRELGPAAELPPTRSGE